LSASKEGGVDEVPPENILRITDELVKQINRAKKLVVVVIAVLVVGIPLAWHAAPLFSSAPGSFRAVGYFTILVALLFLAIGVRQWMVLSKWTARYKAYKDSQAKIDSKLDFEAQPDSIEKGS
jgi:protein-S-isoprenylcysteine O-methyltransferase Ste14